MNAAQRLTSLMNERGMSVYALAKASGLPWTTVKNILTESSNPTVVTLEQVCRGLGITLSQFFADGEEPCVCLTARQQRLLDRWNAVSQEEKKLIEDMLDVMMKNRKE